MSAQRNKTDAADALGLAHIVRTGRFKAAFIKSEPCYRMRLLLSQRRNLKRKFLDLENSIRHSLKAFGIRFKGTGRGGFEAAAREAVAGDKLTSELMDAMLIARAALWKQCGKLHGLVVKLVARNELCRRFMAIPGVGHGAELHDGDRRPVAVPPLAQCRRLFWPDLAALAVRFVDRRSGPHQQGG
jgi:transposase